MKKCFRGQDRLPGNVRVIISSVYPVPSPVRGRTLDSVIPERKRNGRGVCRVMDQTLGGPLRTFPHSVSFFLRLLCLLRRSLFSDAVPVIHSIIGPFRDLSPDHGEIKPTCENKGNILK